MKDFSFTKQLVLALLVAVAIAACHGVTTNNTPLTSSPTAADCRTVSHNMGETEICGQPQTIAVLGPNLLELLLALDVQPAGFAGYFELSQANYDNPAQQIPYLGDRITTQPVNLGQVFTPSIETLVELKPDLILVTEFHEAQYARLSQIAPTVLLDWFDADQMNLQVVAQAVGQPEKAEELIAQRQQQIAAARAEFAPVVATHPEVLMLNAEPVSSIYLVGKSDSCGSLIADLGFQLVYPPGWDATDPKNSSVTVSWEALSQLNNADSVVLFGSSNPGKFNPFKDMDTFEQQQLSPLQQSWKENAIAQSLNASKSGRVYFIPTYLCRGLPGPIGTELYLEELKVQLLPAQPQ
ncbi:MAG: ABC transporter substrate-binding protein [Leptolyngbya sp. SIO4C5]|nr:ABC transporter substrate-binding protein [Leptolyngbya sp. SIO4C5]